MDFKKFKEKYQKKEVRKYPHKVTPTPLVSVMVQTFQHKNYIKDCLNAILNQETDFPYEILLGEDFSSDGTREICIEYAERYPEKIRLFLHHPENKIKVLGITTGNFNALYNFFSAKGEFIAFCEGDDLWTDPLKLQKQVDSLENHKNHILSFHDFQEVREDNKKKINNVLLDKLSHDISAVDLRRLLFHPLLSTVCFRKKFTELPEEICHVINVDSFLYSLLGYYGDARYLNDINPGIYRRHLGGIWSGRKKELKFKTKINTFLLLEMFYKGQKNSELNLFFKKTRQNHKKMLLVYYIKNKKGIKAGILTWNILKNFNAN